MKYVRTYKLVHFVFVFTILNINRETSYKIKLKIKKADRILTNRTKIIIYSYDPNILL